MQLSDRAWTHWLRLIFFLSGFAGLVFEVLWTRQLAHVVGATSVAMTCVFSVFIVCLALGALAASRVRLFGPRALRFYGGLEIAIGVTGSLLTLLLLRYDVQLAGWLPERGGATGLLLQMVATFVLIGLPTTLMGATLPLVMDALRGIVVPRDQVTFFYGVNVIGGACGALACGFVLIWKLGITGTALFALATTLVVGGAALLLAGAVPVRQATAAPSSASASAASARVSAVYPLMAFLTGGYALAYELLWGRMTKLYLGDRTMATSALLFIYLACMALGSLLTGRLRPRASLAPFAAMLAVASAAHLFSVSVVHFVIADPRLNELLSDGVWPRLLVTLGATLVPVTVLGMAFPFLMQTSRRIDQLPGAAVGRLYFVNAVGGMLGAMFGGYFAPRGPGTLGGFLVVSGLMTLTAVVCYLASSEVVRRRAVGGVAAILLLLLGWWALPDDLLFYDTAEELVASHEDEYGIQVVTRDGEGHLKVKSNRIFIAYKLGSRFTSYAQETGAYFSCMLADHCTTVLNVGTGYGITAGAYTLFDELESLETVEMLPFVCGIQPMFGEFNFHYYDDSRVVRRCTDGRRLVASRPETYDVLSVNVLDPYLPGSSGLFTTDFWRLARSRLRPGGVYTQLIWGADAQLLLHGMRSVFPQVLLFPSRYKGSYNAVAFADDREPRMHTERITERMEAALTALEIPDTKLFFVASLENALAFERELTQRGLFDERPEVLHTDDHPILEYRWAKGDPNTSMFDSMMAWDYD